MSMFGVGSGPLRHAALACVCMLWALSACGDDGEADDRRPVGGDGGVDAGLDAGAMASDAPPGVVVRELEGGGGIFLGEAMAPELPDGWVEQELSIAAEAVSYEAEGMLPADGFFELTAADRADYRTRVVVRRPPAAEFGGTVVVEWLNVSGGVDANPDYAFLKEELLRSGVVWVGVSAQHIGVEGGPVLVSTPASEAAGAGMGLKARDPERYGELAHPGDAFAYDIYTQVARALRGEGAEALLGGLEAERILAVGESQSAYMLTTYANGVQPLERAYDGFLIHSRGGGRAPLGEVDSGINLVSGITAPATRIRTDLEAPVLILQTETDMLFTLNYFPARQPDSDRLRTWEVAGTAHADAFLLGAMAEAQGCPEPINAGPLHFVAKAALRHLDRWVALGEAPPAGTPLEVDGMPPALSRDADGIALGGIRTPHVDAPVDVLSGAPPGGSIACSLFGSTLPLGPERLAELYASREDYLAAYDEAAGAVIDAGFVLEEDREALLADADPERAAP
ncbi:MAG: alpha/beta hydrolase domain-containing protein [Myxococcales bacterium]|nr:alpha/beta hydrolase domain-containing protein [Myxococcales bacterium]